MKTINKLMILAIVLVLNACGTTAKFPVSKIAPAAEIVVKKKMDAHKNINIELTAKHLTSPDRLSPPGKNYNLWIVTKDENIKNVGQLNIKNAKKSKFKTTTAFDFNEIFITVENRGNLMKPTGTEICRTKI
ncbi:hypothetical protein OIU80_20265 [Flavobacterium sp. LS1R47]|uniref:Lipoprotein n=1 Tax=Flavobacterium frigoritolerans TaxID=2987686 RepID=A0A9X3CAK6_9FLAO|nr:hypothetical protein [Flavobacterium frigoritolerans]MCV9934624.1 hypothetical protein [Flavobacterium frigoritolerans]